MGIDYHVYVGPYVQCQNEKVDLKKTRRSCTNSNCKRYKDHIWDMKVNFCSNCGNGVGQVDYVEKGDRVSVDSDELEEMLYSPFINDKDNIQYWLGNGDDHNGFGFDPKHDDNFVSEVVPETAADEIQAFKQFYKKPIAKLIKEFGEGNVQVKWGVISYAH